MNRKELFQDEFAFLQKIESMDFSKKSTEELDAVRQEIVQAYKKLVRSSIKIVRISDQLQKDLTAKNEEIQKLSQMKDDFLAVASHDLRGPFTAIHGFTHLLLKSPDILEKDKVRLRHIKESSEVQLNYIRAC